ncbi:MAG TPA: UDP-glucose/GDP-mannose dehydrogenase family protein [Rhizobiales bacterium]|nr:UDP-glucose/GDP-mannose dehydrogenase family protein [Hyphomicrobiales bacterium]
MRILMIGTGYVGLVTGACFAEIGHFVTCMDKDKGKIEKLNNDEIPIFEPGLEELVAWNKGTGKLRFIDNLDQLKTEVPDFVFLAVGTPSQKSTGKADLSFVFAAAQEAAEKLSAMGGNGFTVFVTKSTVPVGTSIKVRQVIEKYLPPERFAVASNPEFLREGAAIEDFMKPDRIVVGSDSEKARAMFEEMYRPLTRQGYPLVVTSTIATAELTKYAANAFLATKITFINELSRLCEKVDARVDEVALGLGLDSRIGNRFLNPGPGFGGSCLPKDTLALIKTAIDFESPLEIVETVIAVNDKHKHLMTEKIRQAVGGNVRDKRIGILGLAFKAHTDDVRYSPSLTIIADLQKEGASVISYDPEGMEQARQTLPDAEYANNAEQVFDKADLVVLVTEWPQFTNLDWPGLYKKMNTPTLVDLRNILPHKKLRETGFTCHSIGGFVGE